VAPLAPVQYILQLDTSALFNAPLITDTSGGTSLSIALAEEFYYWRVRAFDMAGNQGNFSDHDSVGVDITPPQIESTTVWNDTMFVGPYEVTTWVNDGLSGVDSVMLHYKRDQDPVWLCVTMQCSLPNLYVDTIPAVSGSDDSVRYYIEAVDLSEPGNVSFDPSDAPSNYYGFYVNATGVEDLTTEAVNFSFAIGQNPVRDRVVFNISIPCRAAIDLRIYDVSGRLVTRPAFGQMNTGKYQFHWSPQTNAGIYFYAFDSPWQKEVGKIVIVK
jgi:hypothetical protein